MAYPDEENAPQRSSFVLQVPVEPLKQSEELSGGCADANYSIASASSAAAEQICSTAHGDTSAPFDEISVKTRNCVVREGCSYETSHRNDDLESTIPKNRLEPGQNQGHKASCGRPPGECFETRARELEVVNNHENMQYQNEKLRFVEASNHEVSLDDVTAEPERSVTREAQQTGAEAYCTVSESDRLAIHRLEDHSAADSLRLEGTAVEPDDTGKHFQQNFSSLTELQKPSEMAPQRQTCQFQSSGGSEADSCALDGGQWDKISKTTHPMPAIACVPQQHETSSTTIGISPVAAGRYGAQGYTNFSPQTLPGTAVQQRNVLPLRAPAPSGFSGQRPSTEASGEYTYDYAGAEEYHMRPQHGASGYHEHSQNQLFGGRGAPLAESALRLKLNSDFLPATFLSTFHNEIHLQYRGHGSNLLNIKRHSEQFPPSTLKYLPPTIHHSVSCLANRYFEVSVFSEIGGRKSQEDRFVYVPEIIRGREDAMLVGVFDGTVGDFASETVKDLVVPSLYRSPAWNRLFQFLTPKSTDELQRFSTAESNTKFNLNLQKDTTEESITQTEKSTLVFEPEVHDDLRRHDVPIAAPPLSEIDTDNINPRLDHSGSEKQRIDATSSHDARPGVVDSNYELLTDKSIECQVAEVVNDTSSKDQGKSIRLLNDKKHPENSFAARRERCFSDEVDQEFFSDCHLSGDNEDDKTDHSCIDAAYNIQPQPISSQRAYNDATECFKPEEDIPCLLMECMTHLYFLSDAELVRRCAVESKHYASSTSVIALVAADHCCIGHLGDSRAALGFFGANGELRAEFLTVDHKPDLQHERDRIVTSGGSVEYLHNHDNKPFIRGGDFLQRKTQGEQAMQLQYSRAFGGKDLKMFGLSNEPDLRCFKVRPGLHVCLILASDGLWDIYSAQDAVELAVLSMQNGKDPAEMLVRATVDLQNERSIKSDNVTAFVVSFR